MKQVELQLLRAEHLPEYLSSLTVDIQTAIEKLGAKSGYAVADFEKDMQRAATFSSNIEGNTIDFDTFLKNKQFQIKSKPKEMAEIEDLVKAYNYAMTNRLDEKAFLETHKILSRKFLSIKSQRGALRDQMVGIFGGGQLVYMAVEPAFVRAEFDKLFSDIQVLLAAELSEAEALFFASMIHLVFEKIHPFMDGNGRAGRLLEKWFLAEKLGKKAWAIASEQFYAENRADYYQNLHLGIDYYTVHWERCLPFLWMLPGAMKSTDQ